MRLEFDESGDQATVVGIASSIDGIISTRRGNGSGWKSAIIGSALNRSPFGRWTLTLPDELSDGRKTRDAFENDEFADIPFAVTYTARTAAWPE